MGYMVLCMENSQPYDIWAGLLDNEDFVVLMQIREGELMGISGT